MFTKNGSYCENEKKERKSQGGGGVGFGEGVSGWGVRVDVNGEVKLFWKLFFFWGGGGGGGVGQGGFERRSFCEKKLFWGGGGGGALINVNKGFVQY